MKCFKGIFCVSKCYKGIFWLSNCSKGIFWLSSCSKGIFVKHQSDDPFTKHISLSQMGDQGYLLKLLLISIGKSLLWSNTKSCMTNICYWTGTWRFPLPHNPTTSQSLTFLPWLSFNCSHQISNFMVIGLPMVIPGLLYICTGSIWQTTRIHLKLN